jgi:hypothetical protein
VTWATDGAAVREGLVGPPLGSVHLHLPIPSREAGRDLKNGVGTPRFLTVAAVGCRSAAGAEEVLKAALEALGLSTRYRVIGA